MHGFGERPHYKPRDLDSMFEKIVVDYPRKKAPHWIGTSVQSALRRCQCTTAQCSTSLQIAK